jgi:ketosteroid isomerase-like protein
VSSPNVEAVRNSLDGWNRGDVDAWLEAAHPDIEWTSEVAQAIDGSQRVYRGREEMRHYRLLRVRVPGRAGDGPYRFSSAR